MSTFLTRTFPRVRKHRAFGDSVCGRESMADGNGTNGNGGAKDGITRRDFLDGVAISAAGLAAASVGALFDRRGGCAGGAFGAGSSDYAAARLLPADPPRGSPASRTASSLNTMRIDLPRRAPATSTRRPAPGSAQTAPGRRRGL